ncbi:MAG: lipopolysaccharide heptosyltransferase II [Pseudomonadota bacterium]
MINLQPRNILIRCPNWVGDLVMCTPALRSIRRQYPDAEISVMVKPSLKKIIEQLPFFDAIIEYEPRGKDRGIKNYIALVRTLRARHFDLGIAMTSSFSSAQLLFLSGIPVRVGYDRNARGWLLTHRKKPLREKGRIVPVNKVKLDLGLCEFLGCADLTTQPELATSKEAEAWVDAFYRRQGIQDAHFTVAVIPGATFGPSKCWKQEYFARVADALIKAYNAQVLILPGPGELDIARSIIKNMKERPVAMGDTIVPLDVLMALVRRCSLLITNDTGPRHFGVAFDKPVIVIMGSTDARHTDCNLEKTTVLQEKVECGPCHLRECPSDHRCMTRITPEMVLEAAREKICTYNLIPVRTYTL